MTTQDKPPVSKQPGRDIRRRGEFGPINPWEEMERFFEGSFPRNWLRFSRWPWPEWTPRLEGKVPAVDVIDRPDHILVRAELPGIKKEDLDVSVSDNLVTLRTTAKYEEEKEEGQYYRRELGKGEYSRTVSLPTDVDSAEAHATFKDGILELILPKTAPSKRRSVKVE